MPNIAAPTIIAALTLRSSSTCFQTSNGASFTAIAQAARKTVIPSAAKINAFSGANSVTVLLYVSYAPGRKA